MGSNAPGGRVAAPEVVRRKIEEGIAALARRPRTPGLEIFEDDRCRFLAGASSIGDPRLFTAEGVPTRYLTPMFWGPTVGGIVASDPAFGEVVAWPSWGPGPTPLFALTMAQIDRMLARGDPRVGEFVPRKVSTPARFGVDPAQLASATMLERYEALPFKNQEDRYTWVTAINTSRRMKTRWRYNAGLQEPSYKCLSYASSTIADWWGLVLGHAIEGRYQNFVNGTQEYGVDPRGLEVLYHHRAATIGSPYRLAPRTRLTLDPVTRERIPISSLGYAQLLCSPGPQTLGDPLTKDGRPTYAYDTGMYHMDGPPLPLFDCGRADEEQLKAAIHRHGIVLAFTQARILRFIRFGLHGIPIIGYFQRDGQTFFVYHESYGNHGPGYIWDNSGGPAYMSIPAKLLRDATTFPHRLWIDATDEAGGIAIAVEHSEGGVLGTPRPSVTIGGEPRLVTAVAPGRWLAATGSSRGRLRIEVDRECFRRPDGTPFAVDIPQAPGASALDPLVRWLLVEGQVLGSGSTHVPPHVHRRRETLEYQILGMARAAGDDCTRLGEGMPLTEDERRLISQVLPERLARASTA